MNRRVYFCEDRIHGRRQIPERQLGVYFRVIERIAGLEPRRAEELLSSGATIELELCTGPMKITAEER